MAGLIPDERCFVLASNIFFLLIKMEQAISGTSAATYKMMEPYSKRIQKFGQSYQMKNDILKT